MPNDTGTIVDPQDAAEGAGLVYVNDTEPGITRRRAGKGWSFRGPDGKPIRDKADLARIRARHDAVAHFHGAPAAARAASGHTRGRTGTCPGRR